MLTAARRAPGRRAQRGRLIHLARGGVPGPGRRAQRGPLIHFSVHEPVDDLCKKAASLCAGEEMLGIAAALRWLGKPFTCANTIHTLCIKESTELSTRRAVLSDK